MTGTPKALVAGGQHSCAISPDNRIKCWGLNAYGQLGLGDANNRGDNPGEMGSSLPYVSLGTGRTVKKAASGLYHVCAILDNNRVKCWGGNQHGQLGLGDTNHRGDNPSEMGNALPYVDLGTGRTAKAIATGVFHTCAILDNDQIKCWGYNSRGQLGLGDTNSRGDNPGEMGNALPAVNFGNIPETLSSIFLGGFHSCASFTQSGTGLSFVKCWGWNDKGQLDVFDTANRGDNPGEMATLPYTQVVAGVVLQGSSRRDHTCVLTYLPPDSGPIEKHIACWGSNVYGQLGRGNTNHRGDELWEYADWLPISNVAAVYTGGWVTCITTTTGAVKCWGHGASGTLGLGNTNNMGDAPGEVPTPDIQLN